MKYKIFIQTVLIFTFFLSAKCFAITQITKNIVLRNNTPYLVSFDEKITGYKFEKENVFKAEFPSSIFDTGHEIIIVPVKNINNNLTVWTKSQIYKFSFQFTENNEFEIYNPPVLNESKSKMNGFELDIPPKLYINHRE